MKRLLFLGLLAVAGLLADRSAAQAQYAPGVPCTGSGMVPSNSPFGGCSHLGCGGFCFKFLGKIHQHGPLFNYGPYTGYYPFEPYGPWASAGPNGHWGPNLVYTGPRGQLVNNCVSGPGLCGHLKSHGGLFGRHGSGCGWGGYARTTFHNVFMRVHPLAHKSGHCCDTFGWLPGFGQGRLGQRIEGGCPSCGAAPAVAGCASCTAANSQTDTETSLIRQTGMDSTGEGNVIPRRER